MLNTDPPVGEYLGIVVSKENQGKSMEFVGVRMQPCTRDAGARVCHTIYHLGVDACMNPGPETSLETHVIVIGCYDGGVGRTNLINYNYTLAEGKKHQKKKHTGTRRAFPFSLTKALVVVLDVRLIYLAIEILVVIVQVVILTG